jgi:predicted aspartyl protease
MKDKINLEFVSFGDHGLHVFCKAKINGKKVRALIDTGASKSVVSQEYASKISNQKLVEIEGLETRGIGSDEIDSTFIEVKNISLGKVKIKKPVIGILDLEHVADIYDQLEIQPFDLIIGSDILFELRSKLDFNKATLEIRS